MENNVIQEGDTLFVKGENKGFYIALYDDKWIISLDFILRRNFFEVIYNVESYDGQKK